MLLWLLLAVSVLILTTLMGLVWMTRRSVRQLRWELEVLAGVLSGHSDKIAALGQSVLGLPTLLKQQAEAAKPPAPWLGVVLPTDETNAEVERRLRTAEDHAMSSQDLRPGSSPPSRRLARI